MAGFTSWEALRAEISVNEERVAAYGLVMEAEGQFYALLQSRGLSGDGLDAAFAAMQDQGAAAERDDDPYLSIVTAYVTALGGRIEVDGAEVRAVFLDGTVRLPTRA